MEKDSIKKEGLNQGNDLFWKQKGSGLKATAFAYLPQKFYRCKLLLQRQLFFHFFVLSLTNSTDLS